MVQSTKGLRVAAGVSRSCPGRNGSAMRHSRHTLQSRHILQKRMIHLPMAQSEETEAPEEAATETPEEEIVQETPVKLQQSDLKTFEIPSGMRLQTAVWFLRAFLRGGSGSFVDGYKLTSTEDTAESRYKPLERFGFQNILETTEKIAQHKRPEKPVEIYEYEACPFCRKVREATTILDLDVMFYPTPRGSPHHRAKVQELGGKQSYPFMVDPNTGTSMYESDDIVAYLFKQYGDGNVPLALKLGFLTSITCALCSAISFFRGFNYTEARYPEEPLIFWGYELSPFSVFVREVLTELELPFLQICCGRGSPKRQQMKDKLGVFQVPYIEDPNTGVTMFESDKIIQYLKETYAL